MKRIPAAKETRDAGCATSTKQYRRKAEGEDGERTSVSSANIFLLYLVGSDEKKVDTLSSLWGTNNSSFPKTFPHIRKKAK